MRRRLTALAVAAAVALGIITPAAAATVPPIQYAPSLPYCPDSAGTVRIQWADQPGHDIEVRRIPSVSQFGTVNDKLITRGNNDQYPAGDQAGRRQVHDSTVVTGMTVIYYLRAKNRTTGEWSAPSNAYQITTDCGAPGVTSVTLQQIAPPTLSGTTSAAGETPRNTLTWTATETDKTAGYEVWRSTDGGATWEKQTGTSGDLITGTEYQDDFVQEGVSYTYVVNPVDYTGHQGPPSNTISLTPGSGTGPTEPPPEEPPSEPTEPTCTDPTTNPDWTRCLYEYLEAGAPVPPPPPPPDLAQFTPPPAPTLTAVMPTRTARTGRTVPAVPTLTVPPDVPAPPALPPVPEPVVNIFGLAPAPVGTPSAPLTPSQPGTSTTPLVPSSPTTATAPLTPSAPLSSSTLLTPSDPLTPSAPLSPNPP